MGAIVKFRPSKLSNARRNPARAADIVQAYGISLSFANKIVDVSNRLGLPDPALLANVINFESKFRADIQNSIGATGLIQFIKSTAAELGTTTDALVRMSPEDQMEYVYRYFMLPRIRSHGPLRTQEDVYMAVFYPVAIGKPDYVFPLKVQLQNFGFQTPKDYAAWANSRAKLWTVAQVAGNVAKGGAAAILVSSAVSISVLAIAAAVYFRRRKR